MKKQDRKYTWIMNRSLFTKDHNYHRQYLCCEHSAWRVSNFFDSWVVLESGKDKGIANLRKFKKFESAVRYAEKKIDKSLMAG